jgi:hypothetical protein
MAILAMLEHGQDARGTKSPLHSRISLFPLTQELALEWQTAREVSVLPVRVMEIFDLED